MKRACPALGVLALLAFLLPAAVADAKPTYCNFECDFDSCKSQPCTDPMTLEVITCGAWGTYDYNDPDCDNIPNSQDNCDYTVNYDQADCDGDGSGDACDSQNADYQYVSGSAQICYIWGNTTYGMPWDSEVFAYWEGEYEDVSSCGAPDEWRHTYTEWETCNHTSDPYWCCQYWFPYECGANYGIYSCQF